MSIYTTPLQFGYFFSLVIWVLLLIRGYREQRLSDRLLGWVMFILAMELQDYTFGFAGINYLWNELNGFPRSVSLLFGPMVYFYFLAQTNRSFSLEKKHLWHFLPYGIYFVFRMVFFLQGPEAVEELHSSTLDTVLSYVLRIGLIISFSYYLSQCLVIYKKYRNWSQGQFSNLEMIDFKWFRNFIHCMIFWLAFREGMMILDVLFTLDFYQDWWWNLALVAVSLYIGLAGYSQKQPARIHFSLAPNPEIQEVPMEEIPTALPNTGSMDIEKSALASRLDDLMQKERLFLQPELSLQELAQHVQTNPVQLSATINQVVGKNFNDYINALRVEEFIKKYHSDPSRKYTLLALALDSGFNSKATFNRAFKKIKGSSPQEYFTEEGNK
jgi:AraC-like DNA-binding protein